MGVVKKKKKVFPSGMIPPHDSDAEAALLGSALYSKDVRAEILERVTEEDFYMPAHKEVLKAMVSMTGKSMPVDLVTLTTHLRDIHKLDEVGGHSYITMLFTCVPTASNFGHYLQIVKDKTLLRDMIERAQKTINYAVNKESSDFFSIEEILSRAQIGFGEMRPFSLKPPKSMSDYVQDKMDRMQNGTPDADIVQTGLIELDRYSPVKRGDMPMIKAKYKMGKSILALSILENICVLGQKPGLYVSLESRKPEVIDRLFAGVSHIPQGLDHVKKLSPEQITRATAALEKIASSKLEVIDDSFDLPVILSRCKKFILDNPETALIVIDYLQLVRTETRKEQTREGEVATVSRAFRLLAMETGVPVIVISQINQQGTSRESQAMEQDCTAAWALNEGDDEMTREIHIEVQRNGPSNVKFPVRFFGHLARVENAATDTI